MCSQCLGCPLATTELRFPKILLIPFRMEAVMTFRTYRSRIGIVTVSALGIALVLALTSSLRSAGEKSGPGPLTGSIFFASLGPRGWEIYLTEGLASGSPKEEKAARRLTNHYALDYNAAFSPDGKRIAFVSERDGNLELYVMNRDGSGLVRLTKEFALDDHPTWSPDGKRIAFCSAREPSTTAGQAWNAIYLMNADGSAVRRISPKDTADYSPAWSPQGDWIACASGSGVPNGTDLYVMKPDGRERKLVVKDGGWPAFAADGESLYFHRKHSGKWGIWHVKLDGTNPEKITPDDINAFTPRVAVDGKSLVMAVKRGKHRQIEHFDLATKKFTPLTRNLWITGTLRFRLTGRLSITRSSPEFLVANVELWGSPPGSKLQMFRVGGCLPRHLARTANALPRQQSQQTRCDEHRWQWPQDDF